MKTKLFAFIALICAMSLVGCSSGQEVTRPRSTVPSTTEVSTTAPTEDHSATAPTEAPTEAPTTETSTEVAPTTEESTTEASTTAPTTEDSTTEVPGTEAILKTKVASLEEAITILTEGMEPSFFFDDLPLYDCFEREFKTGDSQWRYSLYLHRQYGEYPPGILFAVNGGEILIDVTDSKLLLSHIEEDTIFFEYDGEICSVFFEKSGRKYKAYFRP